MIWLNSFLTPSLFTNFLFTDFATYSSSQTFIQHIIRVKQAMWVYNKQIQQKCLNKANWVHKFVGLDKFQYMS